MNGAFGLERYGFSSTDRTANSLCSSRVAKPRASVSSTHAHVGTLRVSGLVEVTSGRDPLAFVRDEETGEAWIGRERRLDVPVPRGHETDALPLALDDEPGRGTLDAPRRQARVDLLPEDGRHLVPVEAVEDAPRLGRIDEAVVDAPRTADCLVDRRPGDLVEHHPLDRHSRLQRLEQVPRDGLALAVLVRGEEELVRILQRRPQLLHHFLAAGGQLVGRFEAVVDVDGEALARQIGDVSDRRAHLISVTEEARNRLRFRGRLHDDERPGHRR